MCSRYQSQKECFLTILYSFEGSKILCFYWLFMFGPIVCLHRRSLQAQHELCFLCRLKCKILSRYCDSFARREFPALVQCCSSVVARFWGPYVVYLLAKIDISALYSVLLNVINSVCKFTDERKFKVKSLIYCNCVQTPTPIILQAKKDQKSEKSYYSLFVQTVEFG